MEYKDFINRLYLRNHWYKANKCNEVVKISKGEFAKELFLNSVDNERIITDYRNSDESFKGYNKGHSIAKIAKDVLSKPDLGKLELFLKTSLEYVPETETRNNVVNRICENFKDVIDDITPENMCKKIAVFFLNKVLEPAVKNCGTEPDISHSENPESSEIQIPEQPLNEADEIENPNKNTKPDKTANDILSIEKPAPINASKCKNPETVKSEKYSDLDKYNNESIDNADTSINVIDAMSYNPFSEVSKADIEDIRNLIINLSVTAESLVELGKEIGFNEFNIGRNTAIYEFEPLYTKFDEEYNEFCKLHKKSKFYYNKYPHLFSIIYSESPIINKNLFLTSFSRSKYGGHEPYSIIEYIAKLSKLSIQLREYETK